MKKISSISLFVFFVVAVAVVTAGLLVHENGKNVGTNNSNSTTTANSIITDNYSMTEIAKHNSAESCWLLIANKVYDVTTYMNEHPGNADTILINCGKDATQAYETKGRTNGKPHSASANALLQDYYIGNLK